MHHHIFNGLVDAIVHSLINSTQQQTLMVQMGMTGQTASEKKITLDNINTIPRTRNRSKNENIIEFINEK